MEGFAGWDAFWGIRWYIVETLQSSVAVSKEMISLFVYLVCQVGKFRTFRKSILSDCGSREDILGYKFYQMCARCEY